MYLTPHRGLFVYLRGVSRPASSDDLVGPSLLEVESHDSLDSIAQRGTAGVLAFPGQDDTAYSSVDELRDIFGIGRIIQADYRKAFHRLRVALFTDSLEAREFGETLGLHATYLIPSTDLTLPENDITSNQTRDSIIQLLNTSNTESIDMCLVYLTATDQASTATSYQQYISWANALCNALLHTDDSLASRVFFTIAASPSGSDVFNASNHHHLSSQYPLLANCSSTCYQQQFNISPSYSIWNDKPIHQFRSQHGIYAVFHADSTRHDAATVFSEKNCIETGASGRVLPCQLLAEMAFKLGCTPKYGA
ncbi:hypothetical protein BDF22DRAFT_741737 [Syncephalis plumigaleata]|nr:hypothetical protein BDF22DRAFT_741737 [Syncephalis plumigaleata]